MPAEDKIAKGLSIWFALLHIFTIGAGIFCAVDFFQDGQVMAGLMFLGFAVMASVVLHRFFRG